MDFQCCVQRYRQCRLVWSLRPLRLPARSIRCNRLGAADIEWIAVNVTSRQQLTLDGRDQRQEPVLRVRRDTLSKWVFIARAVRPLGPDKLGLHLTSSMQHRTMIRLALLLASLLPLAAHGATYRCTDAKGRTTLQDFPCEASSRDSGSGVSTAGPATTPSRNTGSLATAVPSATTGDYSTTRGAWRGPAQFHVVAGGQRDVSVHRISPIVIELAADGKVTGILTEVGCRISGLTTQLVAPTLANVDVTLTGCADSRFNTRMSGTLAVHAGVKETKLYLANVGYTRTMAVQQLTLDAVLRR